MDVPALGLTTTTNGKPGSRPRSFVGDLVGGRYELLNELADPNMGAVYRALDRLTGRVVTLKRVRPDPSGNGGAPPPTEGRRVLAEEFCVLASLRHPNIISVLDYGFDRDRQPYFTMDLEENARTIIAAGHGQPLALRLDLLVQTLRAVAYLHRHGIIHRDLKPENVVVVGQQVKVLDFGLSMYRAAAEQERGVWAGSLPYMAPEMLRAEPITHRADLYAVGVIAYELIVGTHPFPDEDAVAMHDQILRTRLPRPGDDLDPRVRPVLARLLAKRPEERYADASDVIDALGRAVDQPLAAETVATRESFLRAAPLVGRTDDLETLTAIVREAARGRGSVSLVAGESGVGKSRLLDEARTRALVDGMTVTRGHARNQGGEPYHAWREVLSHLVLRVELADAHAAALKTIVPNLETLLGRSIPDPPEQDDAAGHSRLLLAVEEVFRLQPGPTLVILEDLHWAGSATLEMLAWIARIAATIPTAVLGSFRDDQASGIPELIEGSRVLRLRRLTTDETAMLTEAMIGPAARRKDLLGLMERETEGIPFLIVEVVRALAESAHGLQRIADMRLPDRVVSGGVQLMHRRLSKIPPCALPALQTAAVIGRVVDASLVSAIHPDVDVDQWTRECAAATIFEVRDQRWWFAHDRLRDQLLEALPAGTQRTLHRAVAEAIERSNADGPAAVSALAHHWREAGEPGHELPYAEQAGLQALQSGACREAIEYLTRALELVQATDGDAAPRPIRGAARFDPNGRIDPAGKAFRLGMIEGALTEARFRLGDIPGCRVHAENALRHFGYALPHRAGGYLLDIAMQSVLRTLQLALRVTSADGERARRVTSEVARVQLRLVETIFYSPQSLPLVWGCLRMANHCAPAGPSPDLAKAYVLGGILASVGPATGLANRWCRRALALAEETGGRGDVAWILSRAAVVQINTCRWDDVFAGLARGRPLAEEVGDLRLLAETIFLRAMADSYTGNFERALDRFDELQRLAARSGDRQVEGWGLLARGNAVLRLGREDEALSLYERAYNHVDQVALWNEWVSGLGSHALGRFRTGDHAGAYDLSRRALGYIAGSPPLGYWMQQGTAALAEVMLLLLEENRERGPIDGTLLIQAEQAAAAMRAFARRFALGHGHALVWSGLHAWLVGRERRAVRLWHRAIAEASRLRLPYELARAQYELGRHLPQHSVERERHLAEAVQLFERLGCTSDLARARREFGEPDGSVDARRGWR